jgi:hypothetical protein
LKTQESIALSIQIHADSDSHHSNMNLYKTSLSSVNPLSRKCRSLNITNLGSTWPVTRTAALPLTKISQIYALLVELTNLQLKYTTNKTYPGLKNGVFWDVTPCCSCKSRRFGGKYRLHQQGDKNRRARKKR